MTAAVIEMGIIVGSLVVYIVGAAATWHYMTAPIIGNCEDASHDEKMRTSARAAVVAVVWVCLWVFGLVWTCIYTSGLGGVQTGPVQNDGWGNWWYPTTGVATSMILILVGIVPMVAGVVWCVWVLEPDGTESIRARVAAGMSAALWPGFLVAWALIFGALRLAVYPVRLGRTLGHQVVSPSDRELIQTRQRAAILARIPQKETEAGMQIIDVEGT